MTYSYEITKPHSTPVHSKALPSMRPNLTNNARGFTILELLISVIIISVLVAIIITVYSNRAAEARIAATQADLDALRTAQEHAAIDTGYFYRLYVLDNVVGGDGVAPNQANDITDGVRDEQFRTDAFNPTNLFIDTVSGQIINNPSIYQRLIANETSFNWNGPYVNIARKAGDTPPKIQFPSGPDKPPAGSPVDPYNNVYLFFTKEGLVKEPDGVIATTFTAADGQTYNAVVFDRPTILSLGLNGLPGDGSGPTNLNGGQFGQGDDMFRQF
jgi:prepilin-type N-terminal cleavage/methylation domain-containing protein